ncbi:MAG: hypothetical protein JO197_04100 [Acidobacteria bacterium]|nr:hypothetical protein [Acidobacteriota bacterium]MBV9476432.1 hypothetical protein [Acidobacteriota bacterium]
MRQTIRGHAEARWLPSRHRYALFRLYAYLRLLRARPEPKEVALFIDRDQSAGEQFGVSVWILLMVFCFVAGELFEPWPLPLAFAAAVPVTIVLIEIPLYAVGLLLPLVRVPIERHVAMIDAAYLLLIFIGALVYARSESWLSFVAWQFLGIVMLNVVAAAIVFLLRGSIARLERRFASEG